MENMIEFNRKKKTEKHTQVGKTFPVCALVLGFAVITLSSTVGSNRQRILLQIQLQDTHAYREIEPERERVSKLPDPID